MSFFQKSAPEAKDNLDASRMKFGIVVAEWNEDITSRLFFGCYETLLNYKAKENRIKHIRVPGSYELVAGAQFLAETRDLDVVICLGCVIKGETDHDTYINHAVAQGLTSLTYHYQIPFIFGVVTVNNMEQAKERSGGKKGHKGEEAAIAAIKMVGLQENLS